MVDVTNGGRRTGGGDGNVAKRQKTGGANGGSSSSSGSSSSGDEGASAARTPRNRPNWCMKWRKPGRPSYTQSRKGMNGARHSRGGQQTVTVHLDWSGMGVVR